MNRPLTTHGWTASDEARAARIRAERGVLVLHEVNTTRAPAPFTVAGADITAAGLRVTLFRPRREPPCEG